MEPPLTLVRVIHEYDSSDDDELFNWNTDIRKQNPRSRLANFIDSALGITLALLSGTSYAVSSVFIVFAQRAGVTQYQIKFLSGVVGTLTVAPCLVYKQVDPRLETWKDRFAMIANGAVGTLASIALLYALPLAPLGNINAIIQGMLSIVTATLACLCLKEFCRVSEAVASVLNVIGILLIARPEFLAPAHTASSKNETLAYGLTLVSVLGISAGYVIGRAVRGRVNVYAIMFYNSSVGTVMNCVLMLVVSPAKWDMEADVVFFVSAVCVSTLFSTWTRYKSLQLESAATVALLSNIQLVVAYLADIFIFKYTIYPLDFAGAGVVVLGSVVVSITSYKKNHNVKKQPKTDGKTREELTALTALEE
ncbi:solute carrier family 35 member G1-like [Ptychodera flava]|uniref:solute carrier family 35 member G1-like n=1 Tax=Ptychodera flava TaxID=63121 RepID=UPI00396AA1B4